jgi:hypothetical protein
VFAPTRQIRDAVRDVRDHGSTGDARGTA